MVIIGLANILFNMNLRGLGAKKSFHAAKKIIRQEDQLVQKAIKESKNDDDLVIELATFFRNNAKYYTKLAKKNSGRKKEAFFLEQA